MTSCQLYSYSRISQHFTDPDGSLPCSLVPPDMEGSCGNPTRCGPPVWGLGVGLTTPRRKKISSLRNVTKGLGLSINMRVNIRLISTFMNNRKIHHVAALIQW
jgi:hypothetical protein